MRLDIGIFAGKNFLDPVDGQLFDLIHHLASTVIPSSRITFRVFVCKHSAHGLHYLEGGKIFRCDQFDSMALTLKLFVYEVKYKRVSFHGAKLGELA
jgi:hypothetical protein